MKQNCNCGEIIGKKTILRNYVVAGITTEFSDNGVFKNNKALTLENNYCSQCGEKYEIGGEDHDTKRN